MSSLQERRRRLAQAQRITALKERRAERSRRDASRVERESCAREAEARDRHDLASDDLSRARAAFFANPGDPHADVWLIANTARAEHAALEQRIATEHREAACAAAQRARHAHHRLRERATQLDAHAVALGRLIAQRSQDSEDQDMQERRS